jgi:cytochrome P450
MAAQACSQMNSTDDRKTSADVYADKKGLIRRSDGSVTITSFALARRFLRSESTKQAGFNADLVKLLTPKDLSVLFLEGDAHRIRRSVVSHFFAPSTVRERYLPVIERLSRQLVKEFEIKRYANLDDISLQLSVGIAAEVIGMTNSLRAGLGMRLSRFLESRWCVPSSWPMIACYIVAMQINLAWVYFIDVRPALRARRLRPRKDMISYLLQCGWSDFAILKESVTYGTAGISTTRDFIVVAAWHITDKEDLRQTFIKTDHEGRVRILEEIVRLEPPVSLLHRKTVAPVRLQSDDDVEYIAPGTHVTIDVRRVNTDSEASGPCPFSLQIDRERKKQFGLMSFGDGHHRCPGATLAIEETAIFLHCLLQIEGLRLTRPTLAQNAMSTGYVLRGARLCIEPI